MILNTPQVTPSPDAIAEFKMVTSTINPEYGRNSGAILNAVIKSGSNQFHGDGFNFYRDTSLNARNFFEPSPDVFHRNQFGGTVGGPVWKNHTFFFFSYQGTRERRPEDSADCGCGSPGTTPVYSSDQRNGIFPDVATSSTLSPFPLAGREWRHLSRRNTLLDNLPDRTYSDDRFQLDFLGIVKVRSNSQCGMRTTNSIRFSAN